MQNLFASWSYVLNGLLTTFQIAGVTLVFATLISAVFGVLATVRNPIVRGVIHIYVELFRAIPLIVNVFFIYFTLPTFGLDLPPFASVALGLTLWGSANGIEIVRGGIQSVPAHQWSSAWALGMRPWRPGPAGNAVSRRSTSRTGAGMPAICRASLPRGRS